jgi:hypothetical protein
MYINYDCRGDYRQVYTNVRPVLAKVKPEWSDEAVFSAHLDQCSKEAKQAQSCLIWYSIYAQKPLDENTAATAITSTE